MEEEPKLVSRRDHKKSAFQLGRTIGEKREHLETRNERAAARKKDKQKKTTRLILSIMGFVVLITILIILAKSFFDSKREDTNMDAPNVVEPTTSMEPTIEIVDESASATGGKITNRMREYIGQIEADLKSYNITPLKAVIPRDAIREVDFYLDGYTGYVKTIIDRGAGVTAEDTDRMLRYLAGQGITDFEYIDVRIDGRAFWK